MRLARVYRRSINIKTNSKARAAFSKEINNFIHILCQHKYMDIIQRYLDYFVIFFFHSPYVVYEYNKKYILQ